MTKIEELIRKVRNGQAAILNDGTVEQLREVLRFCFPNDNYTPSGVWKYYYKNNYINTALKYRFENETFLPTVSVKEFYEKDENTILQMIKSGRDWDEDFSKENGNYINTCIVCKKDFMGYKRKVLCKICSQKPPLVKNEDEFVCGEEVEASSDKQHWVNNRFFAGKNPINKNYIAVSEYGLLQQYKYIRKIPSKTKLTHQMIADKFDIDVNNLEII